MPEKYVNTGGGGRIQIIKTKEYIEKLFSYTVYIAHSPENITVDTDIIHFFSITETDYIINFIRQIKHMKIKICLSTIYWDFSYLSLTSPLGNIFGYNNLKILYSIGKLLAVITSKLINRPSYFGKKMKKKYISILTDVDAILPNSIEEGNKLLEYIGKESEAKWGEKIYPIVNGVYINDENIIQNSNIELPENFILEVGRIEYAKNQYMIVKSLLNDKDIPIVFLGKNHYPNSRYSRELYNISQKRGNVYFFDEIPYEEVPIFYKKALVHVLPSLRESPGLVSLEALFYGCKAVVSDHRFTPVDTYFGDYVTVIDPLDCDSIRKGIFREIKQNRIMNIISEKIRNNFSWEVAAKQTVDVYKKLLN
jgi:glycosyltransferase involved in cell wall biosynthesis